MFLKLLHQVNKTKKVLINFDKFSLESFPKIISLTLLAYASTLTKTINQSTDIIQVSSILNTFRIYFSNLYWEHSAKSVRIRSYFCSVFGLNMEVQMHENKDQKNTLFGHFLHSGSLTMQLPPGSLTFLTLLI